MESSGKPLTKFHSSCGVRLGFCLFKLRFVRALLACRVCFISCPELLLSLFLLPLHASPPSPLESMFHDTKSLRRLSKISQKSWQVTNASSMGSQGSQTRGLERLGKQKIHFFSILSHQLATTCLRTLGWHEEHVCFALYSRGVLWIGYNCITIPGS